MSTSRQSVSDLLFGQIRAGVLGLLCGQAEKSFYLRQIARHLGVSVGAVQRELGKLAAAGLVVRTETGNLVFYQANRLHPVFPEIQSLINKTVGIFHVLSTALQPLSARITVAFVYGSVARQQETAQSDIDLMIVGQVQLEEVFACFAEVESVLGRPVNPTVYSTKEFKRKLFLGNHFLNAVLKGKKVFIIGTENELRKVA
jgi:predicted nucleotidyltransferase